MLYNTLITHSSSFSRHKTLNTSKNTEHGYSGLAPLYIGLYVHYDTNCCLDTVQYRGSTCPAQWPVDLESFVSCHPHPGRASTLFQSQYSSCFCLPSQKKTHCKQREGGSQGRGRSEGVRGRGGVNGV